MLRESIFKNKIKLISLIQFTAYLLFFISYASCGLPSSVNVSPKIKITHNSNEIESRQTVHITSYSGNPLEIVLTIENTGISDLVIGGCNTDSKAFTIIKNPASPLALNEKTELKILFKSEEIQNNTLMKIQSNALDTEEFKFYINCVKSNIEVFFTGPGRDLLLQERLIEKINSQPLNEYLDLCFYGFDNESIIAAIVNAISKGVHVRFVGDLDGEKTVADLAGNYYAGYFKIADALDKQFPAVAKKRINFPIDCGFDDFILINDNIMHNKFAILTDIDQNKFLFTGSANCTESDFKLNNNNSLLIKDNDLANTYKEQFEYLLGLPGRNAVSGTRHHVIEGIPIDILFPPSLVSGNTAVSHLINLVNSAGKSVKFMIFSFTHRDLINEMINKHNSGINVDGVFDESQLQNSFDEVLVHNGISCKKDGNYFEREDGHGGKLHHKTMIIDDSLVITGSYNWSYNADRMNNENILIVYSKDIADLYKNEWQWRWAEGQDMKSPGAVNDEEYIYQDVLINEVMWMGSRKSINETESRDEFIELKNLTDKKINLNGWSLDGAGSGGKTIYLDNCLIDPHKFLILVHKNISDSSFHPENYFINTSLSIPNDSLQVILRDQKGNEIDRAGNGSPGKDFAGYSDIIKKSMARKSIPGAGNDFSNWFTSNTQANISTGESYSLFNLATPGEDNQLGNLGYSPLNLVISEIAWAGTDTSSNDEWLELYNNTDKDINLAGWTIEGGLNLQLYGIIPAYRHFLLERTDDNTVPEKTADLIYTGSLSNDGEKISLTYNYQEIDAVEMEQPAGWAAGSTLPVKMSMSRTNNYAISDSSNWQNGPGDTEGAQNSLE